MVPRIHKRGTSFKGACGYVLHDPGKELSDRVAWVMTQHLHTEPETAWFEMFDTYRNRSALKANAGVDPRGRDNTAPVLHYTLSWHANDNPDPEHMRAMALASLKALGLSEHEALIASHKDKEHHHVHVVANTVHPYSGKTAPLKFSKLEFSKWAEAYEKEHGIHCEERIKNNERRREIARDRASEKMNADFAHAAGRQPPERKPFEPVKDASPNRRQWFERKVVIDKMKALRAALDHDQKLDRSVTWARQRQERDQLDKDTKAALDHARGHIKQQFKGQWRDLYAAHKREVRHVSKTVTHPLERAVYLFQNRSRFGEPTKPLSIRRMIPMIFSARKLMDRMFQTQERERRSLARFEKHSSKQLSDRIWVVHREKFHTLQERQAAQRSAERSHQMIEKNDVTFARAKDALIQDGTAPVPHLPDRTLPSEKPRPSADQVLMTGTMLPRVPIAEVTPSVDRIFRAADALPGVPIAPHNEPPPRQTPSDSPVTDTDTAKAAFRDASQPLDRGPNQARVDKISREMAEWRRKHPDRDHKRER